MGIKENTQTPKEQVVKDLKEQILKRKDVMGIFGISQVTLWNWMKKGVITYHTMEKSVYFIRDEIMADLRSNGNTMHKLLGGK